jgi:hypothetical protein
MEINGRPVDAPYITAEAFAAALSGYGDRPVDETLVTEAANTAATRLATSEAARQGYGRAGFVINTEGVVERVDRTPS